MNCITLNHTNFKLDELICFFVKERGFTIDSMEPKYFLEAVFYGEQKCILLTGRTLLSCPDGSRFSKFEVELLPLDFIGVDSSIIFDSEIDR